MAAEFQMAISPQPVVRSTSLFGYRAGFLGTADLIALFSIRLNSRWRRHLGMAISPQRLTIYLYSAHRAVIFAIAQLSCILFDFILGFLLVGLVFVLLSFCREVFSISVICPVLLHV